MSKTGLFIAIQILFLCFGTRAESKQLQLANRVLHSVSQKYAPDKRTSIFNMEVTDLSGQMILKGRTNFTEARKMILDSLSILNISFVDSTIVLPESKLGEKTWGIVKLSVANMRSVPAHSGELASQILMGTPVRIWDSKGDWLQVQTPDQYIGWVDEGAIIRKNEHEMTVWKKANRYIFNKINGFALDSPNKNAAHVSDLVLCDLFEVLSEVKGFFQVRFPDGRLAFVKKNECLSYADWTRQSLNIQSVLTVARQMLGVPYFWGGTSSKATDCSGLTKTSYYSQGVILARDASQQVRYGMHPNFSDYQNLQPGDLIFFGSNPKRVTHVGMYLGQGKFIHASGSSAMVRLNSLNPNDPLFDANLQKMLVGSSRIASSLNTEGITRVKDHPWYSIVSGQ